MNAPFATMIPMLHERIWLRRSPLKTLLDSAWAVQTCCVGSFSSQLPQATARHLKVPLDFTVQTHFIGSTLLLPPSLRSYSSAVFVMAPVAEKGGESSV